MTTNLSVEDQAEIIAWPERHRIACFQCVSRDKNIFLTGWPTADASKIDFRANLARGLYDNGIFIRTGLTLDGDWYTTVLDFDGWDSIKAWFGNGDPNELDEDIWNRVLDTAKRTRIEWHKPDKTRLHMFIQKQPVFNMVIKIGSGQLEIRGTPKSGDGIGVAVFSAPSVHKPNKDEDPSVNIPYSTLDTKDIARLTESQLLGLKASIEKICIGYMSNEDKKAYDKWLDLPMTILGVNQGRHNATVFKVTSYYWRQNDGWLNLDDNERFKRAWEWHLQHCDPPRTFEEFKRICQWVVKKCKEEREIESIQKQRERGIYLINHNHNQKLTITIRKMN